MPGRVAPEPLGSLALRLAAQLRDIGDRLPAARLRTTADQMAELTAAIRTAGLGHGPLMRAAHELTEARMHVLSAARGLDQARDRLDGYAERALGVRAVRPGEQTGDAP